MEEEKSYVKSSKVTTLNDVLKIYEETKSKLSSSKKEKNQTIKWINNKKLWELRLRDNEFYKEKIGAEDTNLVESRKTHNKLGQFDYKGEEDTGDLKEMKGETTKRKQMIYIGQVKKGTKIKDGIGIMVWDDGLTLNN